MKVPCELIVWYVIPNIRKEIAKTLVNELGMSQREAATRLCLTESAISQYLNLKRGKNIKFDRNILAKIKKIAKEISISKDKFISIKNICFICNVIRRRRLLCNLHRNHDTKLNNCDVCLK